MAGTHGVPCESPHRAGIESAHGVRGCGTGWDVCVCEFQDKHNNPIIWHLSPAQQERVIALDWRLAWGFNDKFEKSPWSSIRNSALLGVTTAVSAERIRGGDFIINAGNKGVGTGKISRNKPDGQSTEVWRVSASNARDMCLDGINRVVIHNVFDGEFAVVVRDVETGDELHRSTNETLGNMEQLVAIPVAPGGAYALPSVDGLARISATGSTLWSKPIAGALNIDVDPQGNGYVSGGVWTSLPGSIDPVTFQTTSRQQIVTFVRKYSIGGGLLWSWSQTGIFESIFPPGPPGQVPSDGLVQLDCHSVASDGVRVFVGSDYQSPSGLRPARALVLDANTGSLIQRVDVPGAPGKTSTWVARNKLLIVQSDPVDPNRQVIRMIESTPQPTGPDTWAVTGSSLFQSEIQTIRPVVTLAP